MPRYLVLQGPNLNLLGGREPAIYGSRSLTELHDDLDLWARSRGCELEFLQSNHEGELVDALQSAAERVDGVVFNPGGYSHTSVALRDCIAGIDLPVVEVHLSNLHAREAWRQGSLTGAVSRGVIGGFGEEGYRLAILQLAGLVAAEDAPTERQRKRT
jgi:3-dehydroquinate dehydratase II